MDSRALILARRARFVAASLASVALATCSACGKHTTSSTTSPEAGADAGLDASVQPIRPRACLCMCDPNDPLCSCL